VPAAFFFPEFDEKQAGLLQEQVELLAMIAMRASKPCSSARSSG